MKTFSVLDYGAVNDGSVMTTEALQKALDACYLAGGGEVVIPEGKYLSGDLSLRSHVTLHLLKGAYLIGSRDPEDYFHYRTDTVCPVPADEIVDVPYVVWDDVLDQKEFIPNDPNFRYSYKYGSRWNNGLLRAYMAEDFAVIGEEGSVIDGDNCFDEIGEEHYRGPHGMTFIKCKNITLKGYTIQNTANWAHNLSYCEKVEASGLTVLAGHDGFDTFMGKNIHLHDIVFHTGDDSVAGYGNEHVLVENCLLNSSCSAFRFSGSDVLIKNCKMVGPGMYGFRGALSKEERRACAPSPLNSGRNNMLSAFTHYCDFKYPTGWRAEKIVIEDCEFVNADRFLHYNLNIRGDIWQTGTPLRDITFRRVKATGVAMPMHLHGSTELPVVLNMEDVDITMREGSEDMDLIHAYGFAEINLKNVRIHGGKNQAVRAYTDGKVNVVDCDGIPEEAVFDKGEYGAAAI